jgi:pyrroloquinoline quinone (PQQ) biosynthesis protein C
MTFYDSLQGSTEQARASLLATPLIRKALNSEIDLETYVAFLRQAYHHVRHTTPLLMAAGARMPAEREWLRTAMAEYIQEEIGHEEWILNDIEACGFEREATRRSTPNLATELMVAYAYDTVSRVSPLGMFGMVLVLEGTSTMIAVAAADAIQQALRLPDAAFTYLRSHGALDQDHIKFYASLMNRIDDPDEQALIVHFATVFYRLYGDVLRSVAPKQALPLMRPRDRSKRGGTRPGHSTNVTQKSEGLNNDESVT